MISSLIIGFGEKIITYLLEKRRSNNVEVFEPIDNPMRKVLNEYFEDKAISTRDDKIEELEKFLHESTICIQECYK